MKRVTGIGGIFKAKDPDKLRQWYDAHLGIKSDEQGAFMINFQVDNLEELLAQSKREGVEVDPKTETYDYGKFGWITDPEGNRIELWGPPDGGTTSKS